MPIYLCITVMSTSAERYEGSCVLL